MDHKDGMSWRGGMCEVIGPGVWGELKCRFFLDDVFKGVEGHQGAGAQPKQKDPVFHGI